MKDLVQRAEGNMTKILGLGLIVQNMLKYGLVQMY